MKIKNREKKSKPSSGKRAKSGIIAVIVLWILVIVSLLSMGLARKTHVDLAIAKHSLAKSRSYYAAKAGIIYAKQLIAIDSFDEESQKIDMLYGCGVRISDGKSPEDIFKDIELQNGLFSLGYIDEDASDILYGLQDEERRINLNALRPQEVKIFERLLLNVDVDEELAKIISSSVVDWKDADDIETNPPNGAEDEFYQGLESAGIAKDSFYDSTEELLSVRGMTSEIYQKIASYVTVFPKDDAKLRVNLNTASKPVLLALAGAFIGNATGSRDVDAEALVNKILDYRAGEDNKILTKDDREIEQREMTSRAFGPEKNLFVQMWRYHSRKSEYLRVRSVGVDQMRRVAASIDAVIKREDQSIVFWRRD